ncbi:MAG TPA: pentapeptide repeat-containing protein [Elusimicrobiota bacterium]|nr:pentapeptide repeat-containing protein [Elusimicrobiota bacterium]
MNRNHQNRRGYDWSGENLSGADLTSSDFGRCSLRRADLSRARLRHANLSNADLTDADLSFSDLTSADLDSAILERTSFQNAVMNGIRMTERRVFRCDFSRCIAEHTDLSWTEYQEVVFRDVDFIGVDFRRSLFIDCRFIHADLNGACFQGARFVKTTFVDSLLDGADLTRADFREVEFTGCRVRGARFGGSRGLSERQKERILEGGGRVPTPVLNRLISMIHRLLRRRGRLLAGVLLVGLTAWGLWKYGQNPYHMSDAALVRSIQVIRREGQIDEADRRTSILIARMKRRLDRSRQSPRLLKRVLKKADAVLSEVPPTRELSAFYQYMTRAVSSPSVSLRYRAQLVLMQERREEGRYRESLEMGLNLLKDIPRRHEYEANIYIQLGLTAVALGDYDRAAGYYQTVIDSYPAVGNTRHPTLAWSSRLRAHMEMGKLARLRNQLPEAERCFRYVIENHTDHRSEEVFVSKMAVIGCQIQRGVYPEALSGCQDLLSQKKLSKQQQAEIELQRGLIFSKMGRWDEAIRSNDRAATLSSSNSWIHYAAQQSLLDIQSRRGMFHDAIRTGETLLRENAASPTRLAEIYLQLGALYSNRGRFSEANRYVQTVIERYPDQDNIVFSARLQKADILRQQKMPAEAMEEYRRLLGEAEDSPGRLLRLHKKMAKLAVEMNRLDEAVRHFETILAKYADKDVFQKYDAYNYLADLHRKRKEYGKAERAARLILDLFKEYPEYRAQGHYYLGQIYMDMGREEDAREHFVKFREMVPGLDDDRVARANAVISRARPPRRD